MNKKYIQWTLEFFIFQYLIKLGSGALSGKMLLVRIDENIEIDTYFRAG